VAHRRDVPAGFHCHRSAVAHPTLEAREKAVELTEAARQEIVDVTGLRDPCSKLVGRGIGIALDDRDRVDNVAEHSGSTHARQAAAEHESAGGHAVPLSRFMRSIRTLPFAAEFAFFS
jgi:hypothetical protein